MSTPAGIPTYTSAPVSSRQEEGTHASTSQPEPASIESSTTAASQPANTPAMATAPPYPPIYATAQPGDPPAQPGAAPNLPAPTAGTTQPGNLTATPTTTFPTATSTQSPPPPQPGTVPQTSPPAVHSPVPPPPKAGEAKTPSQPPAPAPAPASQHPTPFFKQSYSYQPSHPSIPNSTSSPYSSVHQTHAGASSSRSSGLPLHSDSGGGGGANDIFQDEPSFMSTAKSWIQSAGAKLADVEAEVWKRINNAHEK
ncbi:hypothetical protein PENDEC_c008G00657 [Penicillium decumbens]|uniref:Uncharacterized protein n=1 Tax=Penicillium decumbens TaxID=69771 RepID=A0A1V6PDI1_PENDC|nr:hypothetical protein PENDEC_c008G00657 [Penicillium decumbens]